MCCISSRGRGSFRGFFELRRPWGFSPEARRGSQGASRTAPGKSGLHAHGEGERVLALESREGTRASRRFEEGLSRSFMGGGGKPSCPSPSAGDLRELPRVPLSPNIALSHQRRAALIQTGARVHAQHGMWPDLRQSQNTNELQTAPYQMPPRMPSMVILAQFGCCAKSKLLHL